MFIDIAPTNQYYVGVLFIMLELVDENNVKVAYVQHSEMLFYFFYFFGRHSFLQVYAAILEGKRLKVKSKMAILFTLCCPAFVGVNLK